MRFKRVQGTQEQKPPLLDLTSSGVVAYVRKNIRRTEDDEAWEYDEATGNANDASEYVSNMTAENATDNSDGIFDMAETVDENSNGIFDLADYMASLEERIQALEERA